jgi:hypothetical protein
MRRPSGFCRTVLRCWLLKSCLVIVDVTAGVIVLHPAVLRPTPCSSCILRHVVLRPTPYHIASCALRLARLAYYAMSSYALRPTILRPAPYALLVLHTTPCRPTPYALPYCVLRPTPCSSCILRHVVLRPTPYHIASCALPSYVLFCHPAFSSNMCLTFV